MTTHLIAGSRGSRLALIQTELIISRLKDANPGLEVDILKIVTSGDRDRQTHLDRMGVAVFVKELEEALLDGRIDFAVHSIKDVPTELPEGLALLAVIERGDPRDVLVAKSKLAELPAGARIGTDSMRRSVQLTQLRPDLQIVGIRGNVDTRLRKVADGEIDGLVTAAAALSRLESEKQIAEYLPVETFLPAVGQGALVIEGRLNDKKVTDIVTHINHLPTWQSVIAERAFLLTLGGGCRAPIAALGTVEGNTLKLDGMVASIRSHKVLRATAQGNPRDAEKIGVQLGRKLLGIGGDKFIAEVEGK